MSSNNKKDTTKNQEEDAGPVQYTAIASTAPSPTPERKSLKERLIEKAEQLHKSAFVDIVANTKDFVHNTLKQTNIQFVLSNQHQVVVSCRYCQLDFVVISDKANFNEYDDTIVRFVSRHMHEPVSEDDATSWSTHVEEIIYPGRLEDDGDW